MVELIVLDDSSDLAKAESNAKTLQERCSECSVDFQSDVQRLSWRSSPAEFSCCSAGASAEHTHYISSQCVCVPRLRCYECKWHLTRRRAALTQLHVKDYWSHPPDDGFAQSHESALLRISRLRPDWCSAFWGWGFLFIINYWIYLFCNPLTLAFFLIRKFTVCRARARTWLSCRRRGRRPCRDCRWAGRCCCSLCAATRTLGRSRAWTTCCWFFLQVVMFYGR